MQKRDILDKRYNRLILDRQIVLLKNDVNCKVYRRGILASFNLYSVYSIFSTSREPEESKFDRFNGA
jgi:hypothetical protein